MSSDCTAGLAPVRREVNADGLHLSYLTWGASGPEVVLLHGITSAAMTWWRVAPVLVQRGYRVVAPDMPGHGDSGKPASGYQLTQTAHTVDAFMSALGLRAPVVVGHSWGGGVALVQATEPGLAVHPARVVLVDPLLQIPHHAAGYQEGLLALLGKPRAELAPFVRQSYPKWHECDVYWKAEALEKGAPAAVRGVFGENAALPRAKIGTQAVPQLARLEALRAPWIMILADPEHGGIVPASLWAEVEAAAQRTQGQLHVLHGVAHDVYREDFDGFMSCLEW